MYKVRTETSLLLAFALLSSSVEAFWGKGHLLVSRRAEAILAEHPEDGILNKALQELGQLTQSHPDLIKHERDHPFTECATFADDIKGGLGDFQTPWHFINQPYLDEEGTTVDDFPEFDPPEVNVVDALTDLIAFLRDGKSEGSDYIVQIAEVFPELADQRSFALRLVIHYLGDIHQPLHAVAEVDHRFPKGDRGGNLQKVPDDGKGDGVADLHAIWDSVIYQAPGYLNLPLDEEAWNEFTDADEKLHSGHPIDESLIKAGQYESWAKESLQISVDVVYKDFVPNEEPSEEYKAKALPILEERIMYGGRRLAEIVKDIYYESPQPEQLFLQ